MRVTAKFVKRHETCTHPEKYSIVHSDPLYYLLLSLWSVFLGGDGVVFENGKTYNHSIWTSNIVPGSSIYL
jgi:hypothetical protein